ncbi:MAG: hypothetical protein PHV20_02105 [Bacteroidales bacterium]|nr:hypothetical protein [Bacteroidales bacterium]
MAQKTPFPKSIFLFDRLKEQRRGTLIPPPKSLSQMEKDIENLSLNPSPKERDLAFYWFGVLEKKSSDRDVACPLDVDRDVACPLKREIALFSRKGRPSHLINVMKRTTN